MTKRASSELVDLAAAHSDNITRTRDTTHSDGNDMNRVLVAQASNPFITIVFFFVLKSFNLLIDKNFALALQTINCKN